MGWFARSASLPQEEASHTGSLSRKAISSGEKCAVLIKKVWEELNEEAT